MKNVEHIGIVVKNLESSIETYEMLLNTEYYKREVVKNQKVETAFFRTGETKIELLGATGPDSVIAKYIQKKGEGLHHIAFKVDDIHAEIDRLQSEGYTLISDEPAKGADNKLVVFIHPRDASGVLVELCQDIRE